MIVEADHWYSGFARGAAGISGLQRSALFAFPAGSVLASGLKTLVADNASNGTYVAACRRWSCLRACPPTPQELPLEAPGGCLCLSSNGGSRCQEREYSTVGRPVNGLITVTYSPTPQVTPSELHSRAGGAAVPGSAGTTPASTRLCTRHPQVSVNSNKWGFFTQRAQRCCKIPLRPTAVNTPTGISDM